MSKAKLKKAAPEVGIILGSGLSTVADMFEPELEVPYSSLKELPPSTVPGHAGCFRLATIGSRKVVIAQGRNHLYEGLTPQQVTANVRLMAELGVKTLVLSNAAGAIEPSYQVGNLMLIHDHLNLQAHSPLTGGPNFVDMTAVYDLDLREKAKQSAAKLGMPLHEGVYAAVLGPQYETPAEVRMLRALGAHAVGMSTVPEAIQARALGLTVVGFSMLTNFAAGIAPVNLSHDEVVAVGKQAGDALGKLLLELLAED